MNELYHHGILGQEWGKRNGPPYPLKGGDYSREERLHVYTERKKKKNSIYNKKHFDKVISEGTDIHTLSRAKDRTSGTDMYFATFEKLDKQQYRSLFNEKAPETIYDDDGNAIGTGQFYRWDISNTAKTDIRVASEDSAAKCFSNLYENDRDFYNFVTDPDRMKSLFVESRYKFRGYREARDALDKVSSGAQKPTEKDLKTIYRMFNYVLPNDGGGNVRVQKDVLKQRTKFFDALKKAGYGAVLDTNDAIYGGFKATAPVIVFDTESFVLGNTVRLNAKDKKVADVATAFRKTFGV